MAALRQERTFRRVGFFLGSVRRDQGYIAVPVATPTLAVLAKATSESHPNWCPRNARPSRLTLIAPSQPAR